MKAAVLTGDFVRSRQGGRADLQAAFDVLRSGCDSLAAWHGAPLRLTRYRGDGWQCLLARPELSFRSVLYLIACLRAAGTLDTRVGLGCGSVPVTGGRDLSDADGTAFRRAGDAIDGIARGRRIAVSAEGVPPLAPAVAALLDAVSQGWTEAQAEVLLDTLPPGAETGRKSQEVIAQAIGIRQQSVADRLDAARYWAVAEALDCLENSQPEGNRP